MPDKNEGFRFTIQFNRNDPRHIQAASVLNRKGQRSKAAYLVETILNYENCDGAPSVSGVDLTSMVESIVKSILSRETNPPAEPSPAQVAIADEPVIVPDNGDRLSAEPVDVERAVRELGEDGVRSIASAMAKLRGK